MFPVKLESSLWAVKNKPELELQDQSFFFTIIDTPGVSTRLNEILLPSGDPR